MKRNDLSVPIRQVALFLVFCLGEAVAWGWTFAPSVPYGVVLLAHAGAAISFASFVLRGLTWLLDDYNEFLTAYRRVKRRL